MWIDKVAISVLFARNPATRWVQSFVLKKKWWCHFPHPTMLLLLLLLATHGEQGCGMWTKVKVTRQRVQNIIACWIPQRVDNWIIYVVCPMIWGTFACLLLPGLVRFVRWSDDSLCLPFYWALIESFRIPGYGAIDISALCSLLAITFTQKLMAEPQSSRLNDGCMQSLSLSLSIYLAISLCLWLAGLIVIVCGNLTSTFCLCLCSGLLFSSSHLPLVGAREFWLIFLLLCLPCPLGPHHVSALSCGYTWVCLLKKLCLFLPGFCFNLFNNTGYVMNL